MASADARSAEASAKAELFRLDIAHSNERAAKAEERAAEASLALARFKAPRTIPSVAVERMRRELPNFKGTTFDLYVSTDSEAVALMTAIENVLTECGWIRNVAPGNILFADKAAVIAATGFGVEIIEEDREKLGPAVAALVGAFNQTELFISISIAKKTIQASGIVHVIVGSKPLN